VQQRLSGGIGGRIQALSGVEVARHWDEADGLAARRAMLIDAIGADHVRVLLAIPGTRVHVFNPDRIVFVPADAPFSPRGVEHERRREHESGAVWLASRDPCASRPAPHPVLPA
jgi:hypothetical protein